MFVCNKIVATVNFEQLVDNETVIHSDGSVIHERCLGLHSKL